MSTYLNALPAIAAGLVCRAAILVALAYQSGLPYHDILAGHDGAEYFEFARAFRVAELEPVPFDIRRHDPGWPMLLAVVSTVLPPAAAALALIWGCLAATIFLYVRMLRVHAGVSPATAAALAFALALAYPSNLYYHTFALTESPFLFCVVASTYLFLSGKTTPAYLIAGAAALIRGPGILLALSFAIVQIASTRRAWSAAAIGITLSALPQAAWYAISKWIWGETTAGVIRPTFSFPFAGFAGIAELPPAKAAYEIAVTLFFLASVIWLIVLARRTSWQNGFLNIAAVFSLLFFGFHACLKTLDYLGETVYTAGYMDRYLIGILPVALYPWSGLLRKPVLAAAAAASIALSLWWGRNYLHAAL